MAAAMLLTGGSHAALVDPAEPKDDKPTVRIVATAVDGGKYVEVGLNIDSAGGMFQSAGAVLRYDAAKLRPVAWTGTKPTIPEVTQEQTASAWSNAVPLPAKTGDGFAEKFALAFTLQTETGLDGYLYLSAAAAQTGTLKQTVPAAEKAEAPAASGLPLETVDKATAAVEQATVVRFAVLDDPDKGTPYPVNDLLAAIDLARSDSAASDVGRILAASPLTFVNRAAAALDGLSYLADNTEPSAAGYDSEANAALVWIKGGVSVATGGGGGSSFDGKYAITFFDWDGRVIDAIPAEGKVPADGIKDMEAKLSTKPGYTFDCWLTVSQEEGVFKTVNGTLPANNEPLPADNEAVQDFQEIAQNTLVMASYAAKDTINSGKKDATLTDSRAYYSLTEQTCYQYANSDASTGSFAIRFKVKRENAAASGVTRAGNAAVVALLYPKTDTTKPVATLLTLENTDLTECEIVASKTVDRVDYWFIDNDQPVWLNSGRRSERVSVKNAEFVSEGALRYLMDLAVGGWAGSPQDTLLLLYFQDAGYTKVTTAKLSEAKNALTGAIKDGKLTYEQAQEALKSYR